MIHTITREVSPAIGRTVKVIRPTLWGRSELRGRSTEHDG
jgi:hypothetical protein